MRPERKRQICNDVVGPVGQPTMSHNLQPNSLGEWRATVLIFQIFVKPEIQL